MDDFDIKGYLEDESIVEDKTWVWILLLLIFHSVFEEKDEQNNIDQPIS